MPMYGRFVSVNKIPFLFQISCMIWIQLKTPHHPRNSQTRQQHMGFYNLPNRKKDINDIRKLQLSKSIPAQPSRISRRCGGENLVALPDRPVRMARVDSGSFLLKSPKATRPALYEVIRILLRQQQWYLATWNWDSSWLCWTYRISSGLYLYGFLFWCSRSKVDAKMWWPLPKNFGDQISNLIEQLFSPIRYLQTRQTDKGETKSETSDSSAGPIVQNVLYDFGTAWLTRMKTVQLHVVSFSVYALHT